MLISSQAAWYCPRWKRAADLPRYNHTVTDSKLPTCSQKPAPAQAQPQEHRSHSLCTASEPQHCPELQTWYFPENTNQTFHQSCYYLATWSLSLPAIPPDLAYLVSAQMLSQLEIFLDTDGLSRTLPTWEQNYAFKIQQYPYIFFTFSSIVLHDLTWWGRFSTESFSVRDCTASDQEGWADIFSNNLSEMKGNTAHKY